MKRLCCVLLVAAATVMTASCQKSKSADSGGCPDGATLQGKAPPEGTVQWCAKPGGVKHGKWIEYHTNGKAKTEGQYADGKMDGHWVTYYDTGKKKEEEPPPQQPYGQQPYGQQPYGAQPAPGQPQPAQPAPGQPAPAQPAPAQPAPAQPAPTAAPLSTPGPLAFPCQSDAQCTLHRCNMQFQKCAFPCQTDNDCNPGNKCNAAVGTCLPGQ